ncbi:MAG TPA: hypothetical protein VN493_13135 [Thermoanaerobaculia bacterium]|nr:hypothetical protein [Thermoanaerobaculia bacterium]
MSPARAIFYGGLTVGVLDGLYAVVLWYLRGVGPSRVFQGVAAGLLGRASFEGGTPTALLGLALHFFIAFCVAAVYYLASKRIGVLTRKAVICGLVYGVLVYLFMTFVVVPLSAARGGMPTLPMFILNAVFHAFLVGLPAALFARAAAGYGASSSASNRFGATTR